MRSDAEPRETVSHAESPARRYATLADEDRIVRTTAALEDRGLKMLRAPSAESARRIVLDLVPHGAQVYQGNSQTLEVAGISAELESSGRGAPVDPKP